MFEIASFPISDSDDLMSYRKGTIGGELLVPYKYSNTKNVRTLITRKSTQGKFKICPEGEEWLTNPSVSPRAVLNPEFGLESLIERSLP